MGNLIKQQKKQLLGRSARNSGELIRNILFLRPSNESAVIREASDNPDMSMKEVSDKLGKGVAQTFFLIPVPDKKPDNAALYFFGGALANYTFTLGGVMGAGLALTGKLAMVDAMAAAIPLTFLVAFGKLVRLGTLCQDNSGYMKSLQKKIEARRRKKMDDVRTRMRQMI